jgi:hypothetical protein
MKRFFSDTIFQGYRGAKCPNWQYKIQETNIQDLLPFAASKEPAAASKSSIEKRGEAELLASLLKLNSQGSWHHSFDA